MCFTWLRVDYETYLTTSCYLIDGGYLWGEKKKEGYGDVKNRVYITNFITEKTEYINAHEKKE